MASQFNDDELSMSLSEPPNSATRPSAASNARKAEYNVGSNTINTVPTNTHTGQRIGQYKVMRTLGEGSFGKVKLAEHRATGQEVALKIISRKKLISRDMAGRVEREIQYLQLLRHPHIIKLYTVITTPSEIIMVLEYAGGELFDYIVKHGKMAEDKARRFFQQIICAVEYCHRHKIVHRDLKPENLLLDKDLNVKIADFGLSNIMTDGNFLKTSCGSPNYAAPEVISGKLYAGPEVDVWSCGIILYVLLVGRLPFDDEYIPALFRKINSGNYHAPSYLSAGARHVIAKMLKVNPVQRITIQEIRQDDWFARQLDDYLRPPVEDFVDAGVDPSKAIDPRSLARGVSPQLQDEIHESIMGKLGKTMGYAKDDVQEALGKEEPNAIKDAYLIVRENQIMQTNPSITNAPQLQPFLAQSPPAWTSNGPPMSPITTSIPGASYPTQSNGTAPENFQMPRPVHANAQRVPKIDPAPAPKSTEASSSASKPAEPAPHVSKVGILTSSLPYYWKALMEQKKKDERAEHEVRRKQDEGEEMTAEELEMFSAFKGLSPNTEGKERPPEEQAATARNLNPHSRSTLQLQHIISQPPQESDDGKDLPSKKTRTRWQFGIRSRNLPHEAMFCVYKALKAQGAQWEVPPPKKTPAGREPRSYPVHVEGATHLSESMSRRSDGPPHTRLAHSDSVESDTSTDTEGGGGQDRHADHGANAGNAPRTGAGATKARAMHGRDDDDIDPGVIPDGYIPKDPWCIKVRWLKTGMHPPGAVAHPSSANTSLTDLPASSAEALPTSPARPASLVGSVPSAATSASSIASPTTPLGAPALAQGADNACYVYMEVQLYTVEHGTDKHSGTYLVDFKCTGYESLVEEVVEETGRILKGSGVRVLEKDVTSPQPFLDLANRLVIHLAGGGGS